MRKNKEICSCFVGENNTKRRRKIKKRRTFLKFCGRFSVIPYVSSQKISGLRVKYAPGKGALIN